MRASSRHPRGPELTKRLSPRRDACASIAMVGSFPKHLSGQCTRRSERISCCRPAPRALPGIHAQIALLSKKHVARLGPRLQPMTLQPSIAIFMINADLPVLGIFTNQL